MPPVDAAQDARIAAAERQLLALYRGWTLAHDPEPFVAALGLILRRYLETLPSLDAAERALDVFVAALRHEFAQRRGAGWVA